MSKLAQREFKSSHDFYENRSRIKPKSEPNLILYSGVFVTNYDLNYDISAHRSRLALGVARLPGPRFRSYQITRFLA